VEFPKKLEENTYPRRSPTAISTEKGRKMKSEELDADFEEWKKFSEEEKFGIATVQASYKSRMSAVKLKEYEDYKDEPRTALNRKQNDGPSRQHDTIASKTRHEKMESENKSTRIRIRRRNQRQFLKNLQALKIWTLNSKNTRLKMILLFLN
jgi:hypothetical protein